jgi:hypothetical protein
LKDFYQKRLSVKAAFLFLHKKMNRIFVILLIVQSSFSQDLLVPKQVDSLYREDQMYVGFTYNLLRGVPSNFSPSGFSIGLNVGFLRDFPLNKERTYAIAPGIGVGLQRFDHNLGVTSAGEVQNYNLLFTGNFTKNRWSFYTLDFPIEFRWRTSSPDSHKFWRIYAGYKGSLVFYDVSRLTIDESRFVVHNNKDFRRFQSGIYVSAGYNTWNFYFYHGFNTLLKSNVRTIENEKLEMVIMTFGLQFYIL